MRTGWFIYLTLVALQGVCLHVAQDRKKRQLVQTIVRCEAGSHTFYHRQAGACLYCNTCIEGYSLVPAGKFYEEFSLKMDPEHLVINCLPCRICKPGTCNDKRTYDSRCRTCSNCTALGGVDNIPCTNKADAAFGDVIEFSTIQELQTSAEEVKTSTCQDLSSQNGVLVILLILPTVFLITTAFVSLRRVYKRTSMRQCIKDAKKKSEDEESQQFKCNFQPKISQPSLSSESTAVDIHVPIENGEKRPKEKAHNAPRNTIENEPRDRIPLLNLTSESATELEKTSKSSNCSSWNLGASDFMSRTQFAIGNTNIALSRSVICQSSDRHFVPGNEDESLKISQFSNVLELRH